MLSKGGINNTKTCRGIKERGTGKDQNSSATNWWTIKKLQAELWRGLIWTLYLTRRGKQEEQKDSRYLKWPCGTVPNLRNIWGKGDQGKTKVEEADRKGYKKGPITCKPSLISTVFWPSPVPNHYSLSYLHIKAYLNCFSIQSHRLSHMCPYVCKDKVPATEVTGTGEHGTGNWREMGLQCQLLVSMRVSTQPLGQVWCVLSTCWADQSESGGSALAPGAELWITACVWARLG